MCPLRLPLARARLGWPCARRAATAFSLSWPYLSAAGRKMAGWLPAISQISCMQPGMLACIQGCLHACEWDFQSASQPASQGPAAARYGQDSENAVAARLAHGHPRRARARGSRSGHIVGCSRARARQQIKISQNSGTPVPKFGKNGWTDCTIKYMTARMQLHFVVHQRSTKETSRE
eukprot:COSAG05_NODE_1008_length_6213_cov_13.207720_4_plen_177_part_00